MDNQGYILEEDFIKMLMNYPMQHINNITDGLKEEMDNMKHLKGESMAKLSFSMKDDPNEEIDNKVSRGVQRKLSQQDYATDARKGDFAAASMSRAKQNASSSLRKIDLSKESHQEKDLKSEKNIQGGGGKGSRRDSSVPSQYEAMSMVMRRRGSADSTINYQIQCTTINNRIKQYVVGLYMEYDCHTTEKLTFDKFKQWMSQHPMVLTHFEKNFQVEVWGSANPTTDMLNFKKLTPEVNFYANFSAVTKKKERLWVEVHKKFLICLQSKEDNVPRRVVLLDGLTMSMPESNNGYHNIVFSSKSPYYKVVHLELEDKQAYFLLIEKYAYLRE